MRKLQIILTVMTAALIMSCQSPEKLMDNGDYDEVIAVAQKRLNGKKKKKERYVKALEAAFDKAVQRDMAQIEVLKRRGHAADWEKIISIATTMERRQQQLKPYLPLLDSEGYKANFKFVRTGEIVDYAEDRAVVTLYDEGSAYIEQGRMGDKIASQKAYESFDHIFKYREFYGDANVLREEARELGVSYVRIVQVNNSNSWMPKYLTAMLTDEFPVADGFWTRFTFDTSRDIHVDLEARFEITRVEVGPNALREEVVERSRRIEDGWDYVYDERGNVAKDTSGNDIRVLRYLDVRANVVRTYQNKAGAVTAQIKLIDLEDGRVIDSRPFTSEVNFSHTAQSYFGDRRALRNRDRRVVLPVPFPTDEDLIIEASENLKPMFIRELKKNSYVSI